MRKLESNLLRSELEEYGAQRGPRCQQWPSCNRQWSKGACLELGIGTQKDLKFVSKREWRSPPNFFCTISQIGPLGLVDGLC